MTNETFQKTYEDQLLSLPDINRAAIQSHDWMTEVITIGKKHGLHIDQIDDLRIEVMLVLVGALPAQEFQNTIMAELAVSPAESAKITEDINKQIFDPIHDFIVVGNKNGVIAIPISAQQGIQTVPQTSIPVAETQQPAMENTLQKIGITMIPDPVPVKPASKAPTVSPGTMGRAGVMPQAQRIQKVQDSPKLKTLQEALGKTLNPKREERVPVSAQSIPIRTEPSSNQAQKTLESVLNAKPTVPQKPTVVVAVSPAPISAPAPAKPVAPTSSFLSAMGSGHTTEDKRAAALRKLDAMLGGGSA